MVQEFRRNSQALVNLALSDVTTIWDALDLSDGVTVRYALEDFLPDLVEDYGQAGAVLAAEFYEDLREVSEVPGRFTAISQPPPPPAAVQASSRWAIGPLFLGDKASPTDALTLLSGVAQRQIMQAGRDTLFKNAQKDKTRPMFARVPSGTDTCKFCLILASRGAVYTSERDAGKGNKYHDNCWCTPTLAWKPEDLPRDYDPDALYERYKNAHDPGMSLQEVIRNL